MSEGFAACYGHFLGQNQQSLPIRSLLRSLCGSSGSGPELVRMTVVATLEAIRCAIPSQVYWDRCPRIQRLDKAWC